MTWVWLCYALSSGAGVMGVARHCSAKMNAPFHKSGYGPGGIYERRKIPQLRNFHCRNSRISGQWKQLDLTLFFVGYVSSVSHRVECGEWPGRASSGWRSSPRWRARPADAPASWRCLRVDRSEATRQTAPRSDACPADTPPATHIAGDEHAQCTHSQQHLLTRGLSNL